MYLAGEAVFLLFTVKNIGSQPMLVRAADPLSFCSGYQFNLKGARDLTAPIEEEIPYWLNLEPIPSMLLSWDERGCRICP
jgi:hypothetical protein